MHGDTARAHGGQTGVTCDQEQTLHWWSNQETTSKPRRGNRVIAQCASPAQGPGGTEHWLGGRVESEVCKGWEIQPSAAQQCQGQASEEHRNCLKN